MSFFPPAKAEDQAPRGGSNLHIASQDSAGTEEITAHKLKQTLFVVIKNSPFDIRMCLSHPLPGCSGFDELPISAVLIYDEGAAPGEEREVSYIKTPPLLVKYVVGPKNDYVDAECRIKALTSQHEDSNFRIRFTALDPSTGEPREPLLSVLSAPIKSVSKPEQLKNPRKGASYSAALKSSRVSGLHLEQARMLQTTAENQLLMLQRIVKAREDRMRAAGREGEILAGLDEVLPEGYAPRRAAGPKKKKRRRRGAGDSDEEYEEEGEGDLRAKSEFADPFDAAFFRFYAAFAKMDPSQSANAVRGNAKRLKNQDTLQAFCECLQTNALKIQTSTEGASAAPTEQPDYCTCTDCPHRKKLANLNRSLDAEEV